MDLDFRDPNKLQLTQFVKNAWRMHVRIINWPVNVPFFKCGVEGTDGFLPGFKLIHDIKAEDLALICDNRIQALLAEAQGKTIDDAKLCVEMVCWDEGKFCRLLQYHF